MMEDFESIFVQEMKTKCKAIPGILAVFARNDSALAIASALSVAVSSIKPMFNASSVENIVPIVKANSASRPEIVFFIESWNLN